MERTCSDENVTTFDAWSVFDLSMIHLTLKHNKVNGQSQEWSPLVTLKLYSQSKDVKECGKFVHD